ncbi:hypothetical protein BAE44_0011244 [Dichanthelium oligosanthes]|uniref:Uncharacterized protein n=1 Tax=Dichanthelium oligosanthes TaxID=888268 RepID=A0A1E5VRJ1_9POAL|nr:hypothetical protein BAE44_0011244 [Dichanthelium oligosanthes]
MEPSSSNSRNVPLPVSQRPLHVTDADEEDESVKQLNECATIYLALQALASPPRGLLWAQDCLVESNRIWKACQARKSSNLAAQNFSSLKPDLLVPR